jgi:hypothetical protein
MKRSMPLLVQLALFLAVLLAVVALIKRSPGYDHRPLEGTARCTAIIELELEGIPPDFDRERNPNITRRIENLCRPRHKGPQ